MLNKELDLVSSLNSSLASFKEDPSTAAAGGRQRLPGARSDRDGAVVSLHSRDPDVWPPPTPQEPRYKTDLVLFPLSTCLIKLY